MTNVSFVARPARKAHAPLPLKASRTLRNFAGVVCLAAAGGIWLVSGLALDAGELAMKASVTMGLLLLGARLFAIPKPRAY